LTGFPSQRQSFLERMTRAEFVFLQRPEFCAEEPGFFTSAELIYTDKQSTTWSAESWPAVADKATNFRSGTGKIK
jgi:hypothetical protein